MFPLHTKSFPSTSSELCQLLNESLNRVFRVRQDPVTIRERSYPLLERIDINLSHAELRANPPRPPAIKGKQTPGLKVHELRLEASALAIGPALADLRLTARDVRLDQIRDEKKEIALVLGGAAEGEIEISAKKSALEAAIAAVASIEAGKQGVTIDEVKLLLRERGSRGVSAEVQLKARKLFFSTVIRLGGNLDLDEELNATISSVTCNGDGTIGALACGVLSPHLHKIDGRTFALMALSLGEIKLRDVRLAVGDKLTVRAEFGA